MDRSLAWASWSAAPAPDITSGRARPRRCGRLHPPRAKAAGLFNNALSRGLQK